MLPPERMRNLQKQVKRIAAKHNIANRCGAERAWETRPASDRPNMRKGNKW